MSLWPSSSTSPVRNTAQLFCITFCILSRNCAVGVPPEALRNLSSRASAYSAESFGRSGCLSPGVSSSAQRRAGGAAEHHEIDQRIRAQPVGAVHRHAGRFAQRHQARDHGVGIAVLLGQRLAVIIRGNAAHVVVHGRQHRDRLAGDIDAGEDTRQIRDARQPLMQHRGIEMVEVQEDMVLVLADPAALREFRWSWSARPRRATPDPWPTAHSAP